MDDKRASTLEALENFIQSQKMLLEQTQEDITKLRKLKSYVLSKPAVDPEDLLNQIHEVGEIHDASHYELVIPKEIDWDVFNGCDPAPLHALTLSAQEKYTKRAQPPAIQTSPLSDLQILVKESKQKIIDPALERCAAYIREFSLDDDTECGPGNGADKQHKEYWKIEIEREREKAKIRELKKRKIHAGLSLPGMGGGGGAAVFVRRDVEDESAEVDVLAPDGAENDLKEAPVLAVKPDLDNASAQTYEALMKGARPSRERRATVKQKQWEEDTSSVKRRRRLSTPASTHTATPTPAPALPLVEDIGSPMDVDDSEDSPPLNDSGNTNGATTNGKHKVISNKPRSETYKQAWTDSEQNLLEQLLEKIPDGEKNRWKKISRAMNGRRTPRQVASRVQKYFEKLKKFGIDITKAHGNASSQVG